MQRPQPADTRGLESLTDTFIVDIGPNAERLACRRQVFRHLRGLILETFREWRSRQWAATRQAQLASSVAPSAAPPRASEPGSEAHGERAEEAHRGDSGGAEAGGGRCAGEAPLADARKRGEACSCRCCEGRRRAPGDGERPTQGQRRGVPTEVCTRCRRSRRPGACQGEKSGEAHTWVAAPADVAHDASRPGDGAEGTAEGDRQAHADAGASSSRGSSGKLDTQSSEGPKDGEGGASAAKDCQSGEGCSCAEATAADGGVSAGGAQAAGAVPSGPAAGETPAETCSRDCCQRAAGAGGDVSHTARERARRGSEGDSLGGSRPRENPSARERRTSSSRTVPASSSSSSSSSCLPSSSSAWPEGAPETSGGCGEKPSGATASSSTCASSFSLAPCVYCSSSSASSSSSCGSSPCLPAAKAAERAAQYQPEEDDICVAVYRYGSFPLRTFLPDGDLDIGIITFNRHTGVLEGEEESDALLAALLEAFQQERVKNNKKFPVREASLVDAEVRILKCIVAGIAVDVSVNKVGGCCSLVFLELADRRIGRDHLFKRSVLLIKSWFAYESHLLGSRSGLLATYCVETLVLHLFHVFPASLLPTPLHLLFHFFSYYSSFHWDRYAVTCCGALPLTFITRAASSSSSPSLSGDRRQQAGGAAPLPALSSRRSVPGVGNTSFSSSASHAPASSVPPQPSSSPSAASPSSLAPPRPDGAEEAPPHAAGGRLPAAASAAAPSGGRFMGEHWVGVEYEGCEAPWLVARQRQKQEENGSQDDDLQLERAAALMLLMQQQQRNMVLVPHPTPLALPASAGTPEATSGVLHGGGRGAAGRSAPAEVVLQPQGPSMNMARMMESVEFVEECRYRFRHSYGAYGAAAAAQRGAGLRPFSAAAGGGASSAAPWWVGSGAAASASSTPSHSTSQGPAAFSGLATKRAQPQTGGAGGGGAGAGFASGAGAPAGAHGRRRCPFLFRSMNVVDPLHNSNNLARSVSETAFYRLLHAMKKGLRALTGILTSGDTAQFRTLFLPNSYLLLERIMFATVAYPALRPLICFPLPPPRLGAAPGMCFSLPGASRRDLRHRAPAHAGPSASASPTASAFRRGPAGAAATTTRASEEGRREPASLRHPPSASGAPCECQCARHAQALAAAERGDAKEERRKDRAAGPEFAKAAACATEKAGSGEPKGKRERGKRRSPSPAAQRDTPQDAAQRNAEDRTHASPSSPRAPPSTPLRSPPSPASAPQREGSRNRGGKADARQNEAAVTREDGDARPDPPGGCPSGAVEPPQSGRAASGQPSGAEQGDFPTLRGLEHRGKIGEVEQSEAETPVSAGGERAEDETLAEKERGEPGVGEGSPSAGSAAGRPRQRSLSLCCAPAEGHLEKASHSGKRQGGSAEERRGQGGGQGERESRAAAEASGSAASRARDLDVAGARALSPVSSSKECERRDGDSGETSTGEEDGAEEEPVVEDTLVEDENLEDALALGDLEVANLLDLCQLLRQPSCLPPDFLHASASPSCPVPAVTGTRAASPSLPVSRPSKLSRDGAEAGTCAAGESQQGLLPLSPTAVEGASGGEAGDGRTDEEGLDIWKRRLEQIAGFLNGERTRAPLQQASVVCVADSKKPSGKQTNDEGPEGAPRPTAPVGGDDQQKQQELRGRHASESRRERKGKGRKRSTDKESAADDLNEKRDVNDSQATPDCASRPPASSAQPADSAISSEDRIFSFSAPVMSKEKQSGLGRRAASRGPREGRPRQAEGRGEGDNDKGRSEKYRRQGSASSDPAPYCASTSLPPDASASPLKAPRPPHPRLKLLLPLSSPRLYPFGPYTGSSASSGFASGEAGGPLGQDASLLGARHSLQAEFGLFGAPAGPGASGAGSAAPAALGAGTLGRHGPAAGTSPATMLGGGQGVIALNASGSTGGAAGSVHSGLASSSAARGFVSSLGPGASAYAGGGVYASLSVPAAGGNFYAHGHRRGAQGGASTHGGGGLASSGPSVGDSAGAAGVPAGSASTGSLGHFRAAPFAQVAAHGVSHSLAAAHPPRSRRRSSSTQQMTQCGSASEEAAAPRGGHAGRNSAAATRCWTVSHAAGVIGAPSSVLAGAPLARRSQTGAAAGDKGGGTEGAKREAGGGGPEGATPGRSASQRRSSSESEYGSSRCGDGRKAVSGAGVVDKGGAHPPGPAAAGSEPAALGLHWRVPQGSRHGPAPHAGSEGGAVAADAGQEAGGGGAVGARTAAGTASDVGLGRQTVGPGARGQERARSRGGTAPPMAGGGYDELGADSDLPALTSAASTGCLSSGDGLGSDGDSRASLSASSTRGRSWASVATAAAALATADLHAGGASPGSGKGSAGSASLSSVNGKALKPRSQRSSSLAGVALAPPASSAGETADVAVRSFAARAGAGAAGASRGSGDARLTAAEARDAGLHLRGLERSAQVTPGGGGDDRNRSKADSESGSARALPQKNAEHVEDGRSCRGAHAEARDPVSGLDASPEGAPGVRGRGGFHAAAGGPRGAAHADASGTDGGLSLSPSTGAETSGSTRSRSVPYLRAAERAEDVAKAREAPHSFSSGAVVSHKATGSAASSGPETHPPATELFPRKPGASPRRRPLLRSSGPQGLGAHKGFGVDVARGFSSRGPPETLPDFSQHDNLSWPSLPVSGASEASASRTPPRGGGASSASAPKKERRSSAGDAVSSRAAEPKYHEASSMSGQQNSRAGSAEKLADAEGPQKTTWAVPVQLPSPVHRRRGADCIPNAWSFDAAASAPAAASPSGRRSEKPLEKAAAQDAANARERGGRGWRSQSCEALSPSEGESQATVSAAGDETGGEEELGSRDRPSCFQPGSAERNNALRLPVPNCGAPRSSEARSQNDAAAGHVLVAEAAVEQLGRGGGVRNRERGDAGEGSWAARESADQAAFPRRSAAEKGSSSLTDASPAAGTGASQHGGRRGARTAGIQKDGKGSATPSLPAASSGYQEKPGSVVPVILPSGLVSAPAAVSIGAASPAAVPVAPSFAAVAAAAAAATNPSSPEAAPKGPAFPWGAGARTRGGTAPAAASADGDEGASRRRQAAWGRAASGLEDREERATPVGGDRSGERRRGDGGAPEGGRSAFDGGDREKRASSAASADCVHETSSREGRPPSSATRRASVSSQTSTLSSPPSFSAQVSLGSVQLPEGTGSSQAPKRNWAAVVLTSPAPSKASQGRDAPAASAVLKDKANSAGDFEKPKGRDPRGGLPALVLPRRARQRRHPRDPAETRLWRRQARRCRAGLRLSRLARLRSRPTRARAQRPSVYRKETPRGKARTKTGDEKRTRQRMEDRLHPRLLQGSGRRKGLRFSRVCQALPRRLRFLLQFPRKNRSRESLPRRVQGPKTPAATSRRHVTDRLLFRPQLLLRCLRVRLQGMQARRQA
ncbi:hypothetical protein BESB_035160 [Besnoitia besnoiti]|uniref:PAP/OAS1 substrate-binding-related domain-containing protein n=1 Tax=Besnoitia besnoiti TaxID=94643 RepID=A0A2A9MEW7_BESBE|nr:hypothetical protein BESB_035160 [Besnoitia besnoiti]PFH37058.1 hypothetical protein BESB_035160 [Besnoitia besnoiti]